MDTRQRAGGPLMVTMIEFFGTSWLFPRLKDLRDTHPDLQLTLLFDDRILNLGMREADIALRMNKPEQPDLIQRHLTSLGFHICGSKDYLDEHGRPERLHDLNDHWLLGYIPLATPPFAHVNWLLDEIDVNLSQDNIMLVNSMNGMIQATKNHAGIAVLPDYIIKDDPNLEIILPQITRPDLDLYFVYAEERRNSRRISSFRDFLLRHVAKTEFKIEI